MNFFNCKITGSVLLDEFQPANPTSPLVVSQMTSEAKNIVLALLGVTKNGACVVSVESGTEFLMTLPNAAAQKLGLTPDYDTDPVTYQVILIERKNDPCQKPDKVLVPTAEGCHIELDFDQRFLEATFVPIETDVEEIVDVPPTIHESMWIPAFLPAVPVTTH
jgi:hypothetical protein